MMTCKPVALFYLLCALLCPLLAQGEEQIIRMRPKQGAVDTSHDYFIGLAQLALQKTAGQGPTRIVESSADMPQARALYELSRGNLIDLDWAGTSVEREKRLNPIRIPLDGGLLGYRALVIRKESNPVFEQIKTAEDLAQLTGIQGSQWPDTPILETAGLKIERPPKFEMMYPMLINRRGDYFPRGLNEVYAEVSALNHPDLVIYDKLLLVYTMPMYFFTAKKNTALAKRIEKGLRIAINDGSMLDYMKKSPITAKAFPLSKYQNSRKIYLSNPNLPPETPVNDSTLWLNFN